MESEKYQMLAKTFAGLEDVLKTELEEIGASDVEVVVRGVKFTGGKDILYKANFCSRTALRILVNIGEFKIKNQNDLYQSVYSIAWEDYFDINQTFAINSTVNSDSFNNSMFVSLKAKDAIVDRFRKNTNKRPSVNTENPDFKINVHASSDTLTVSLDSSGESLHKRGYRVGQNEASMSEVLAAGILKIAGWKGQTDFYDTMCGSGTIPIEAALIARNIPPGMFRQEFAFETWKDFDADLFEEIYNADYEKPFEHNIYASDISPISLKVAQKNAKGAGVLKSIQFKEQDFAGFTPLSDKGLLIINPPYGERMNERKVEPLYAMIGDQLKQNFAGIQAWVFSSSEDGFKNIGLRPSRRIPLFNGPLECSFRLFEVYEGSKKAKKQEGGRRGHFPENNRRDFKKGERDHSFKSDRRKGDFKTDRSKGDFKKDRNERRSEGWKNDDRRSGGFTRDERKSDGRNKKYSDRRGAGYKPENDRGERRQEFKRIKHDDFKPHMAKYSKKSDEKPAETSPAKPKRPRIKKNDD